MPPWRCAGVKEIPGKLQSELNVWCVLHLSDHYRNPQTNRKREKAVNVWRWNTLLAVEIFLGRTEFGEQWVKFPFSPNKFHLLPALIPSQ